MAYLLAESLSLMYGCGKCELGPVKVQELQICIEIHVIYDVCSFSIGIKKEHVIEWIK